MLKDLLRTTSLTPDDLTYLLDLAAEQKADPHRHPDLLRGDIVAIYFAKPSTRTRFSFEAAVHRLGGSAVTVGPSDLQLGRGEAIEDTARTLSHFARAFVIRTFSQADVRSFARSASMPVINALTDLHHPCQSLADLLTLRDHFGSLEGLRIAYVGDGNNVAHSLMEGMALAGGHIGLGCPKEYGPLPEVVEQAVAIASRTGGSVRVFDNPYEAVTDAQAVYTDVWLSMGNDEAERDQGHASLALFQVNEVLLDHARPGALFMHCLPAHRGEEVTQEVIDGPRSVVFEQVENRAHTEQAVLIALLERLLQGSGVC